MAVTINDVRFSYCHLFQPKTMQDGTQKYGVTILIPKTNTQAMAVINAAKEAAIADGVQKKWGGQRPPMLSMCIHDGDGGRPSDGMPFGEECRGCWVMSANSNSKPFVVDAMVQPIINPTDVYSGMWGNVNVNFYSYNNTKKGIGCGLNGVQKTADGEPLAGHVTAEEAFKPVPATPPAQPTYGQPAAAATQPAYGQPAAAAAQPQNYQTPAQAQAYQALNQAHQPLTQAPAQPAPDQPAAPLGYAPVDPITGQPLQF